MEPGAHHQDLAPAGSKVGGGGGRRHGRQAGPPVVGAQGGRGLSYRSRQVAGEDFHRQALMAKGGDRLGGVGTELVGKGEADLGVAVEGEPQLGLRSCPAFEPDKAGPAQARASAFVPTPEAPAGRHSVE